MSDDDTDRAVRTAIVLLFALGVVRDAWVGDDAYITLRTVDHWVNGRGLGWYLGMEGRPGVVWHGGVQKGVTSTLVLLPRERFAVVILTNLEGGGMLGLERLASRVADILVPAGP